MNGSPATADDLRALALYNYGCFTSMLVDRGGVRGFDLHLDRLLRDSRALFNADVDASRVRGFVRSAVAERTSATPAVVRVTLFDKDFEMGRPVRAGHPPDILVTTRPASTGGLAPLRVATVHYERDEPLVKSTALLGQLQRRRAAQSRGYDDALFLDASQQVTEGATWNIAFVRGREVIWPQAPVLPGTAMRLLQRHLPQHGFKVSVRSVRSSDIRTCDFAFASNAVVGVRAIAAVDDAVLPAAPDLEHELRACWISVPSEKV